MKNKIEYLAFFTIAAWIILTGCTTTQTVTQGPTGPATNSITMLDTNRIVNAINLAVPPAVRLVAQRNPLVVPYLRDASLAITLATGTGQITPEQVTAAVNSIGVNEIRTPDAIAAIDAALALYQAVYGQQVAGWGTANVPELKVVLVALGNAIMAGLIQTP